MNAARPPAPVTLEGRHVRLEPLGRAHLGGLLELGTAQGPDGQPAVERFRYLFDEPPRTMRDVERWLAGASHGGERVGLAVVDRSDGELVGRLFLMRCAPEHRRLELGNVLYGPRLARTAGATEAFLLVARHVFEDLGFGRLEWKCDALNAASRRAAERLGFTFEGVLRRDTICKGRVRDTAWYGLLEDAWPAARAALEAWLDPRNLDSEGRQLRRLEELRTS